MNDTTTLRARPAGWTIADSQPARRRGSRATTFTLDAADLATATASLVDTAVDGAVVIVSVSPAGLELTVRAADHVFWETAVLPVEQTDGDVRGGADLSRLTEVATALAADRATVELVVTEGGRVRLEGVDLPSVSELSASAPRPHAAGVVGHRVEIPATLPDGVPIRIPGLALTLPGAVRRRFSRRGVSMANLFEGDDGWYLSGIAQGRPMYALVGKVAVY